MATEQTAENHYGSNPQSPYYEWPELDVNPELDKFFEETRRGKILGYAISVQIMLVLGATAITTSFDTAKHWLQRKRNK